MHLMLRNNSLKLGNDPDHVGALALAVGHNMCQNLLLGGGMRSPSAFLVLLKYFLALSRQTFEMCFTQMQIEQ